MKSFLVSLLTALCLIGTGASTVQAQQNTTGWTPGYDYQYFFDEGFYGNLAPTQVEAAMINGVVHYRAFFGYMPQGYSTWATHHGMSDGQFTQTNQSYQSRGYQLFNYHRLNTGAGFVNQGIWYR